MYNKYTIWYIPIFDRNDLNTKIIDILDTYEDAISRIKEIFETNTLCVDSKYEDNSDSDDEESNSNFAEKDNNNSDTIYIGKISGNRFQDVIGYVHDGRNEFTEDDPASKGKNKIRNIVSIRLGIFKYDKYKETFNSLNKKVLSNI